MRGQISFEYLMIVGIALLIIVPAILFFFSYTRSGGDSVTHSRINEVGNLMLETAKETYALGRHSWQTLDVNMPEAIDGIYLDAFDDGTEAIVITYYTQHGLAHAVFFSEVSLTNATDSIVRGGQELNPVAEGRPGVMSLRFYSQGSNISIQEVQI